MHMTRLESHPTLAGRLIEWVPDAATVAAMASAQRDERRGSYMQEQHMDLRVSMLASGKQDASWLCIAFDIPAAFDADAMGRAITAWIRRHGVLQGWFTRVEDAYVRIRVPAEDITLVAVDAGAAETQEATREHVADAFTQRCTPFDTFGYTFLAVAADERATFYFGADHTYCNGFSMLVAFHELNTLYQGELDGQQARLRPVGDYLDYAQTERQQSRMITPINPAVRYWIKFHRAGRNSLTRFPMDLGLTGDEKVRLVPVRVTLLLPGQADALDGVARQRGTSFAALVYAACALAARDLAGAHEYRFLSPVPTRVGVRWLRAMGWFVNVCPIHIRVTGDDDMFTVAQTVTRVTAEAQITTTVPALRIAELAAKYIKFDTSGTDRPSIVSFLDGRTIPGQDRWVAQRFYGLTGGGDDNDVNVWINRMPQDTHVICSVPSTQIAVANVETFFRYVRAKLMETLPPDDA